MPGAGSLKRVFLVSCLLFSICVTLSHPMDCHNRIRSHSHRLKSSNQNFTRFKLLHDSITVHVLGTSFTCTMRVAIKVFALQLRTKAAVGAHQIDCLRNWNLHRFVIYLFFCDDDGDDDSDDDATSKGQKNNRNITFAGLMRTTKT